MTTRDLSWEIEIFFFLVKETVGMTNFRIDYENPREAT
jgi:hypothetical protein